MFGTCTGIIGGVRRQKSKRPERVRTRTQIKCIRASTEKDRVSQNR